MSILIHSKNGSIYIEDTKTLNLSEVQLVHKNNVDEHEVDAECKANLLGLGFGKHNISLGKSGLPDIDKNTPSKGLGGGKGKLDACIIDNGKLLILIEDKTPNESVEVALKEAIYYCDGLLNKNASDVRIALGYNGVEVAWRVRIGEPGTHKWEKFLIKGVECRQFPTPNLVKMLYSHIDCNRIIEDRSNSSKKALEACIGLLKNKFRQLSFIQNDNHTTIDFTIAFISLKSILEKHGDQLPSKPEWRWSGMLGNDTSALKINIKTCVEYICDIDARKKDKKTQKDVIDLAENFRDVFFQKDKNRTFDFAGLIDEFRSEGQLEALRGIYEAISILPALHSSRIDLFRETYELLADKKTKAAFGQYFTGRHIIRPLIQLLFEDENFNSITGGVKDAKAQNPKKICDPACGTGGFLTETFKHINDKFNVNVDVNNFAKKAIFGYDIFPANVTKTKINLYLAGDGFSDLDDMDTLRATIDSKFDYILTNPPYGKGDISVDSNVISSNTLEVNFLIKIVNMLQVGGKALVIVPDSILEAPSLSPLRDWLITECCIDKIVGLPKFAFAPYTKEKTYALFITKRQKSLQSIEQASKQHEKIWFYIVDNDGYANSDKRFPTSKIDTSGQWLHDELSEWTNSEGEDQDCLLIQRWKQKNQNIGEVFNDEWNTPLLGKKFGYVELTEILKQEFVYYDAVTKSAALKVIHDELLKNWEKSPQYNSTLSELKIRVSTDADNKIYERFDGNKWLVILEATAFKEMVKKLKKMDFLPNKAEDLFNENGEIKLEFEEILVDAEITYSQEDDKFINQAQPKVTRLLNLIPEKYFRSELSERIHIDDLKVEINNIELEFIKLLEEISLTMSSNESEQ